MYHRAASLRAPAGWRALLLASDMVVSGNQNNTLTLMINLTAPEALSAPLAPARTPGRLAIARLWPTVASSRIHVEMALPARGEVRLEAFDVNGRRLAHRALGVIDAGIRRAELDLRREIPAGVIWVRVSQGGAAASAKAVVAR